MSRDVPPLPARVIAVVDSDHLRVIYGVGIGMMDGGIEATIDLNVVPADLRVPNAEFKLGFCEGEPYVERSKS